MNLKVIASLAIVFILAACAIAPSPAEDRWAGIYSVLASRRIPDPARLTYQRTVSRGFRLEQATTRIPVSLGTRFGISYVFSGPPERGPVSHRVIWRFPDAGITNPETKKTSLEYEWNKVCKVGVECHAGWVFIESWELVPGTWTMEIRIGQQQVLQQSFEVVLP